MRIRILRLVRVVVLLLPLLSVTAQIPVSTNPSAVSKVWVADRGDGTYRNPIIHADYSDPDVIRLGEDFYMTASSFNAVPGLPILHSKDLVNWTILRKGYTAVSRLKKDQVIVLLA